MAFFLNRGAKLYAESTNRFNMYMHLSFINPLTSKIVEFCHFRGGGGGGGGG